MKKFYVSIKKIKDYEYEIYAEDVEELKILIERYISDLKKNNNDEQLFFSVEAVNIDNNNEFITINYNL